MRRTRADLGLGAPPRTERRHLVVLEDVPDPGELARPRTRGECAEGVRPCPYVACRHNLFLDVDSDGSLRFNFPDLEPDAVDPRRSCALDIADEGGGTLEDISQLANVTRERIRQIETAALKTLRRRGKFSSGETVTLREYVDVPDERYIDRGVVGPGRSVFRVNAEGADAVDEADAVEESPARISFFDEGADEPVTSSVWSMFSRWQTSRGFDCRSERSKRMTDWRKKNPTKGMKPFVLKPTKGNDEMTDQKKKRGDRLERVAAAVRDGATSPSEIAERLGDISAANVSNALRLLRKKGMLGAAEPGPATRALAKPARAQSTDPTVATLIAKRDELRRKADVLDAAIEELSVAL